MQVPQGHLLGPRRSVPCLRWARRYELIVVAVNRPFCVTRALSLRSDELVVCCAQSRERQQIGEKAAVPVVVDSYCHSESASARFLVVAGS